MLKYLLVPLGTFIVAWAGSSVTSAGMSWYRTINLPSWTPPGSIIGIVWTTIFILTTVAAIMVLGSKMPPPQKALFTAVLVLNGILNFGWSWTFFGQHLIGWAVLEAVLLWLSVMMLILFSWSVSRTAAYLLMPYAAWVAFATYLTYSVWNLNR